MSASKEDDTFSSGEIFVTAKFDCRRDQFIITEQPKEDSIYSRERQTLEEDLTFFVKNVSKASVTKCEDQLAVNDFVAVKRLTHALWSRGKIEGIHHLYREVTFEVFLLDWGDTVRVSRENIVTLPTNFQDCLSFAKFAVLFGISPCTKELDLHNLQLKPKRAKCWDESARNFIRESLLTSIGSKMVVYDFNDEGILGIKLFLTGSDPGDKLSWYCLNELLCEKNFAVPDEGLSAAESLRISSSHWFSDIAKSSTKMARNEIGFLEYAKVYEKQKKAATQVLSKDEPMKGVDDTSNGMSVKGRGFRLLNSERAARDFPGKAKQTPLHRLVSKASTYAVKSENNPTPPQPKEKKEEVVEPERVSKPVKPKATLLRVLRTQSSVLRSSASVETGPKTQPPTKDDETAVEAATKESPAVLEDSETQSLPLGLESSKKQSSLHFVLKKLLVNSPASSSMEERSSRTVPEPSEIHPEGKRGSPGFLEREEVTEGSGKSAAEQKEVEEPGEIPETGEIPESNTAVAKRGSSTGLSDPGSELQELYNLFRKINEASVENEPAGSSGLLEQILKDPSLQTPQFILASEKQHVLSISSLHRVAPARSLIDLGFDPLLVSSLQRFGIRKPSRIQSHVWNAIRYGQDVAYVAARSSGLTLGYLVPLLNALTVRNASSLPAGASPVAVVVCASWKSARIVHQYCAQLMAGIAKFKSAAFYAGQSLDQTLISLLDGYTLLAATPPALLRLLEYSNGLINFNRCCHLVFDQTDVLIGSYGQDVQKIIEKYADARVVTKHLKLARQIIACGNKWSPGFESFYRKVLQDPSLFIGSAMEAALYGKIKVSAYWLKKSELDLKTREILEKGDRVKTLVLCRDSAEAVRVGDILKSRFSGVLVTHEDESSMETDEAGLLWKQENPIEDPILVCTDEVLVRLNISDAVRLILYPFPGLHKLGFNQRLSCALDNFQKSAANEISTECHLLLTKACRDQLLTLVRFMRRAGCPTDENLEAEAAIAYMEREAAKKEAPICTRLKCFGFCRLQNFCRKRHIVLQERDVPRVSLVGSVNVKITSVRSGSRFFGRVLWHRTPEGAREDWSGRLEALEGQIANYFLQNPADLVPDAIDVGDVCACSVGDTRYARVVVKKITERNSLKKPLKARVEFLETGILEEIPVSRLFELPQSLKEAPRLAVEILLARVKPLDYDDTWTEQITRLVSEKILDKELEGKVVLALGNTLWVDRLVQRTLLQGILVCSFSLRSELIPKYAEPNNEHLEKLYDLCRTAGLSLPDYNAKVIPKLVTENPSYAFLPLQDCTTAFVTQIEGPDRLYVQQEKFVDILDNLERDIAKQVEEKRCRKLIPGEIREGLHCLAFFDESGTWHRARIDSIGESHYSVFFVDHGDGAQVELEELRLLPNEFIKKFPFQAVACQLIGIAPKDGETWNPDCVDLLYSLTRNDDDKSIPVKVLPFVKVLESDPVTGGSLYKVTIQRNDEDVAVKLVEAGLAQKLVEDLEIVEQNVEEAAQDLEMYKGLMASVPEPEVPKDPKPEVYVESKPERTAKTVKGSNEDEPKKAASRSSDSGVNWNSQVLEPMLHRYPTSKWFDNEEVAVMRIGLRCSDFQLRIEEERLYFSTEFNGVSYMVDFEWFCPVDVENSAYTTTDHGIEIKICKKEKIGWDRLFKSKLKMNWLRFDFENWNDSDDNSESDWEKVRYLDVSPEKAWGSGSDSSDEDSRSSIDDFEIEEEADFDD